jgi:hypothetical protein
MVRTSDDIQTELNSLRDKIMTAKAAAEREKKVSKQKIDELESQEVGLREEYFRVVDAESKLRNEETKTE